MAGRSGRRSAHEQAVARRLDRLRAQLETSRSLHPAAVIDEPQPVEAERPAGVPMPGRHAARGGLAIGGAQLAVVVSGVLVLVALGAWWLAVGGDEVEAAPVSSVPSSDALVSLPTEETSGGTTVTVDVAGRVRRPGITVLEAGSRVVDALAAAGGARAGVDLSTLNLARLLVDGEQILVGVDPPTGTVGSASSSGAPVSTLVNLNTADQVALEALPGVGPVTAQAILAWRLDQGPFTSVDQLLDVDGIGEATLAELAPFVTL